MKSSLIRVPKVLHPSSRWLLAIGLLWLVVSCQPNAPLESSEPEPSDDLSIAEAKAWFEKEGYSVTKPNARTSAGDDFLTREVNWAVAYDYKLPNKQKIVVAPITHIKKGRALGYKQLWIYKDKKGKNTSRIIEYLFDSTENYKKGQVNLKSYTGLIVIKDWEDEYIGGFLMQNGQTTGAITAFGYEKPTGSTPKSGKTASGFACGFQTNCSTRWVETPPSGGAAIGSASSPPSYVGSPSGYYATVCETNYICVYEESTGMGYPSNGSSNNPGTTIVGNFENLWGTSGGSPSSGTPPSEADVFFNQMAWAGVYFSEEEKTLIRNYPGLLIPHIKEIGTKPTGPNFRLSSADIANYPKFTTLVKNLKTFLLNEPTVMAALKKYSGFTEGDILKMLEFGKGPIIVVEEMSGRFGSYNRAMPNIMKVSASWIRGMEGANLPSTQRGTAFLLAVTILHEFVHYGQNVNSISNKINGKPFEMGLGFEQAAFGIIDLLRYENQLVRQKFHIPAQTPATRL